MTDGDDKEKRRDALLKEMTKWAEIAKSENPRLELDIRKAVDHLRDELKLPEENVLALESMLREPEKLAWRLMPTLPDAQLNWTPSKDQVEWFRDFISKMADGSIWKVPSTGQVYKIDKVAQTFTLITDTENDSNRWHERNKMILALLGYSMVDNKSSARSYSATGEKWIVGVFDFSIAEQENPATPGHNFPPGSRGQDAVATAGKGGVFVRLGHEIGAYLWKFTQKEPGNKVSGPGKTNEAWLKIKDKHERN